MKKSLYFVLFVLLGLSSFAQDVVYCEDTYNAAESAFSRKDYKDALFYYNDVFEKCGEYADCVNKIEACKKALEAKKSKNSFKLSLSKGICDGLGDTIAIIASKESNLSTTFKENWLHVSHYAQDTIWIIVDKNTMPKQREATLEVTAKKGRKSSCKIIQGEGPVLLEMSQDFIAFSSKSGQRDILIDANADWSIGPNKPEWLTVTKLSNTSLRVACSQNRTIQPRTATIDIYTLKGNASAQLQVMQQLGETYLEIGKKYIDLTDAAQEQDVIVESNCEWKVNKDASSEWLSVSIYKGKVRVHVSKNEVSQSRSTKFTIYTTDYKMSQSVTVNQAATEPYLYVNKSEIYGTGEETSYNVSVSTNIPDWNVSSSDYSWCRVERVTPNSLVVRVKRNDKFNSRSAKVFVNGEGINRTISVSQVNRGFAGFYNDYYNAQEGNWRLTWFSIDFQGMTTVGDNISTMAFRWKPVEVSLLNFNLDYIVDGFTFNWEPVVRGYIPITRDGKWSGFIGMGAHVAMVGGDHYFLFEMGAEIHWNERMSSHIFFKYNGGCALGMSFDLGRWMW